jgi:flagellar hook-associated protein 2
VVSKLQTSGLNASYDQDNQRIFLSSKNSGAINDFSLTANDEGGINVLSALGLLSTNDLKSDTYKTWASYKTDADAYQKVQDTEVAKRAASYKAANDALKAENDKIAANNETNLENLKKLDGYDENETLEDVKKALYGTEVEQRKQDENGDDIPILNDDGTQAQDEDGNLLYEMETVTVYEPGSVGETLDNAKKALEEKQKALADAKENGASDDDIAALEQEVADASGDVSDAQSEYDKVKLRYDFLDGIKQNEDLIQANQDKIDANKEYYNYDENDPDAVVTGTDKLKEDVKAELDEKVATAVAAYTDGTYNDKATATKVDGQDAEILMNGAKFTSMDNSFTINGLSFKVLETTSNEVTMTTTDDTDGIYDMIKNFFSEYNKLINEIDSLYNADSASDYEPLLSDEKESMSDSEIEDWEEKIKASLLRRDSTLSSVGDAMKSVLMQGVSVNGTQMYLSSFGINTLGYFSAAENEKNAYHIDGDSDDENSTVRSSDDVLKSMIASDPDTVMSFFTGLANNLHDTLYNQMSASTMSSAFTVYNDKQMSDEYDDYTDKISAQEDKLNDLIDKWYDKFSTMETALSKLDSKSSSLSSLLGS